MITFPADNEELYSYLVKNNIVQQMKQFNQHGTITTYQHCFHVLKISLKLAKKFHLSDEQIHNIIIGAVLHDFYLYDWHDGRSTKEGIHAWSHPKIALRNATKYFELNDKQKNIIRSHMYPTCLLHPPKCIEAWIVVVADKYCAIYEYIKNDVTR